MFRRGVLNDLRNLRYFDWTKHRQIGRSSWRNDSGRGGGEVELRILHPTYFAVKMLSEVVGSV